ncbi:T9SS type A sorting domain-containing protein [bacterium]|nr:T9SS type A sorting domain-containing protein [bacterium]
MKHLFFIIMLGAVLFFAASYSPARALDVSNATEAAFPFHVERCVEGTDKLELTLSIDSPHWQTIVQDGDDLIFPSYPNSGELNSAGIPVVPVSGRLFRIPSRSDFRVEIVEVEYEILSNINIAAFKNNHEHYGQLARVEDSWFPGNIVETGEPAIFHDFRVANLQMFPVQVNTARQEARVYSSIQLEIHFENENPANQLESTPTQISETFLPFYRTFLDWDENELDEYEIYRGKVQVIMHNDETLLALMQPWLDWKEERGYELELLTDEDVDLQNPWEIQEELINRYENSNPKFDYIVIIGDDFDEWGVSPGGLNFGIGDYDYSLLAGDDLLPEVTIGRISVETEEEASTYVNKVLEYEWNTNYNGGWLRDAALTVTSQNFATLEFPMRYWNNVLDELEFDDIDTTFSGDMGEANTMAIEAFQNGIGIYASRGYLGSGLSRNQIMEALQNDHETPIVVDIAHGTGNWVGGNAISEAYIRAGSPEAGQGGVAAFGVASAVLNPNSENPLSYACAWAYGVEKVTTVGQMKLAANLMILNVFGVESEYAHQVNTYFNLMGDPLLWTWAPAPHYMFVEWEEEFIIGQNSLSLRVSADEQPIRDAWVTLRKSDDQEDILVRGYTDSNGELTLNAPLQYPGLATLTVSKHEYVVAQIQITVSDLAESIGYSEVVIIDDGTDGTAGDGDGIPEAGETIGLAVRAGNFGISDQSDVALTASSEDIWVSSVTGEIEFGDIPSGENVEGQGIILVEISSEAQQSWKPHITLTFSSLEGEFENDYAFAIQAPDYAFIQIEGIEEFAPGEEAEITISLKNLGGSDGSAGSATLQSLDPVLTISTDTANLDAMNINEEGEAGSFTIEAHQNLFNGYSAAVQLILSTDNGRVDTVGFAIPIGQRMASDPSGPDRYGYYAVENDDNFEDDYLPVSDWVEINPEEVDPDFMGEVLDLYEENDLGDQSVVLYAPFDMQYYGELFLHISVFGSGMLSMGDEWGNIATPRNYPIPSAAGPAWMIAPYWDPLHYGENTEICTYWDEPGGHFIVEWSNMLDSQDDEVGSFQVVFYSQEVRPTLTGDTEFEFHYADNFIATEANMQWEIPWASIGIENGTQDDGILIAYLNQPGSGANIPEAGSAIRFTTNIEIVTGSVSGMATDIESGDPIEGAVVLSENRVYQAVTDENGMYQIERTGIGAEEYFVADALGYNASTMGPYEITDDGNIEVNFSLTHPEFAIDTDELNFTLASGEPGFATMQVSNTGNGPLDYHFTFSSEEPDELDEPWDIIQEFDLSEVESRNRAATYWQNNIWVAGSFGTDIGYNKLYRYSLEGELLGTYNQPVENHSSSGFLDITTDGQFLYGADRGQVYKMIYTTDGVIAVDAFYAPINNAASIAYDSEHDYIWSSGRIDRSIYAIDMQGNIIYQYPIPAGVDIRNMGYFPDDEDRFNLYYFADIGNDQESYVFKMDTHNGRTRIVHRFDEYVDFKGGDISNTLHPFAWSYISVVDGGNQDYLNIFEIDFNSRWITVTPQEGSIPAGLTGDIDVSLLTSFFNAGEYHAWITMHHNSTEQRHVIPLNVTVTDENFDQHFTPVDATGLPYAIFVQNIDGDNFAPGQGDEIGLFDGDLCVGSGVYNDVFPVTLIGWQQDIENDLTGYTPGNEISYRIWDFSLGQEYEAEAQYIVGNGEWGFGPYSEINLFGNIDQHGLVIPLQYNYFELISTNIQPPNLNALNVFSGIEDLVIVYQNDGGVIIPPNINTIGNITLTQAYKILTATDDELVIDGVPVDPMMEFTLETNRWNWLAYPLQETYPVDEVLQDITDQLIIVNNDDGNFWIPGLVNTLEVMRPGEGYFTYVSEDITFQYNQPNFARAGEQGDIVVKPERIEGAPIATGLPYAIVLSMAENLRSQAAVVELYDGNQLVGKGAVLEDEEVSPVVAWQGSEKYGLDGFIQGNPIKIVTRGSDGSKIPVQIANEHSPKFGVGAYCLLYLESTELPTEFSVQQGYPNPFNPSITVPFALPEKGDVNFVLFNLLGQQVYSAENSYEAGYHRFNFDAELVNGELVSGMYFLQVQHKGVVHTQKLLLLR